MRASVSFDFAPPVTSPTVPMSPTTFNAVVSSVSGGGGPSGTGGTTATATSVHSTMMMLAERQMPRGPLLFRNAFLGRGFFSIAETRFARSPRLNALRLRARTCFFAIFFLVTARRLIAREGVLQLRVCDSRFVDDTHNIHLPLGRRCVELPEETQAQFRELALHRLRLVFQPLVLRRLLRKSLQQTFTQFYKDAVPAPTVEDLRLASSFFSLFPSHMLDRLIERGTRRIYYKGMWVGAPRSARSAARSAVNRSSRSRLSQMLPALSCSGVMPAVAPALYSAFIVLSGVVTDADNNDCSIGECYGETAAIAEGGVTGNGFRVYSNHALTWEVDVFDVAEMISKLPPKQYDAALAYIVERRVQIITQYFRPSINEVQQWHLFRSASAIDVTTHILPRLVPRVFFCGSTIAGPESSEAERGVYFVARGCVKARGSEALENEEDPQKAEWKSFGEYEGVFSEAFDLWFYASTIVDCWVLPRSVIQSIAKIPYLRADILSSGLQLRERLMQRCGPVRATIEHVLFTFLGKRLHPRIVDTVLKLLQSKVYPAGDRAITAGEDEKTILIFVRGKLNQSSAHGFIPHAPPAIYCSSLLHQIFDPQLCRSVGAVTTSWKLSLVAVRNVECWTVTTAKVHSALKIFFDTCDMNPNVLTSPFVPPAPPSSHHHGGGGGGHSAPSSAARARRASVDAATFSAQQSAVPLSSKQMFATSNAEAFSAAASPVRGGGASSPTPVHSPQVHGRQHQAGGVSSHQLLQQQQRGAGDEGTTTFITAVSDTSSPTSAATRRRGESMNKGGQQQQHITLLTPTPPPLPASISATATVKAGSKTSRHHQPSPPKGSVSRQQSAAASARRPVSGQRPTTSSPSRQRPASATRHHHQLYPQQQSPALPFSFSASASASLRSDADGPLSDYPFDLFTLRTDSRGKERVQEMRKQCYREFKENMKGPEINKVPLRLPDENAARRMTDLECLNVHVEQPDKRFLLLMRKLPQTPRVHGKPPPVFTQPILPVSAKRKTNRRRRGGGGGGGGALDDDDDLDDDDQLNNSHDGGVGGSDNNNSSNNNGQGGAAAACSDQQSGKLMTSSSMNVFDNGGQSQMMGKKSGMNFSTMTSGGGGGGGRYYQQHGERPSGGGGGSAAVAAQVLSKLVQVHDDKVDGLRKIASHQLGQIRKIAQEKRVPKPDSL